MFEVRVDGERALSKKAVREACKQDSRKVMVRDYSLIMPKFDGDWKNVVDLPNGSFTFVGPDYERKRSFFGTIIVGPGGVKVT